MDDVANVCILDSTNLTIDNFITLDVPFECHHASLE